MAATGEVCVTMRVVVAGLCDLLAGGWSFRSW